MTDRQPPRTVADAATGVILAGGRATRMGGVDKGLVGIGGRPMIAWVIDALRGQVRDILINANRNHNEYATFGTAVIADGNDEFSGPLAGMLAGMRAARTPYIVVVPCDSPLVHGTLAERLLAPLIDGKAQIAVAHDGTRLQPVFAALSCGLAGSLAEYLGGDGRKIDRWYEQHDYVAVDFSDATESFLNINTPADQQALEAEMMRRHEATGDGASAAAHEDTSR